MSALPLELGVAHGVVAVVHLDRDGLEWLAGLCPDGDGFTADLWDAVRQVEEIDQISAELEPGLDVVLVRGAP